MLEEHFYHLTKNDQNLKKKNNLNPKTEENIKRNFFISFSTIYFIELLLIEKLKK